MLHFNPKALRPVIEAAFVNQCELLLVKDQGLYLMPAEGEQREDGRVKHLVYADSCDPEKDEDWYTNARALVGGDDFGERLTLERRAVEQILIEGHQLWIGVFDDAFIIHVAPIAWVPVADYRRLTMRMLHMAEANYSACVSNAEFIRWRDSAIHLLSTACRTDCKRATPGDREEYQALFARLKQRVDSVNANGAIRYPAF